MQGTLAKLLDDPAQLQRVSSGLVNAVAHSFHTHGGSPTPHEIRTRTRVAIAAFAVCRGDLHFSETRCMDEMRFALSAHLLGVEWSPQMGQCWGGLEDLPTIKAPN